MTVSDFFGGAPGRVTVACRIVALSAALFLMPCEQAAARDRNADIAELEKALGITETVAIMREEGLSQADNVADALFPDVDRAAWQRQIAQLYDAERMEKLVRQGLEAGLEGAELAPMLKFYRSRTGQRTVALELAARRALLDPEAEAAAREAAAEAAAQTGGPKADLLEQVMRIIDAGDLIERNVTASLNADMMFWSGVLDAGGPGPEGEEGETDLPGAVIADLDATRSETEIWMTAFLLMSCGSLGAEQMKEYVEFYETSEGRKLNAALFDGFNGMYDQLAYLLGRAAGSWIISEAL